MYTKSTVFHTASPAATENLI